MTDPVCASIEGWFPPPHGRVEVEDLYGTISLESDGTLLPKRWEQVNMVLVDDLPLWGPRKLYCNRKIVPMLRAALGACVALGDGYELRTLGCFSPRYKRSSGSEYSLHSWGVAVDLNADTNPPIRMRELADRSRRKYDLPPWWVQSFREIGWTWGGDFSGYFDPMHFQWASGY